MTINESYQELDEAKYLRLQIRLLKSKGGQFQRQFVDTLKDSEDFVSFLTENVKINAGKVMPTYIGPLTESSFKEPTADQELQMFQIWGDIPPRTACRVSFWASVTLEHIKDGKIPEPSWLAANGGVTESGEERIDRAVSLSGTKGNKAIDDCVRTVFRRMSGLPSARGNRSVFVNTTFGRGWWRERIVDRISKRPYAIQDRQALLYVVRRSQQYWENLVTIIVSRGSVFGSLDVQDAFINGLAMHLQLYPDTPLKNASTLNIALRRFSNVAASRELGVLEFGEINEIVERLLERVRETSN